MGNATSDVQTMQEPWQEPAGPESLPFTSHFTDALQILKWSTGMQMSELVLYSSSVSSLHPVGPLHKNIKHKTAQWSDLGKQGEFCTKNDAKPLNTELNRS